MWADPLASTSPQERGADPGLAAGVTPGGGDLASSADPVEVLTRRLAQLRDRPWMISVLDRALREMAGGAVEVEGYDIQYCKIKPWRNINVALELGLRWVRSGARERQQVSGTICATDEAGQRQFDEQRSRLTATATATPGEARRFPHSLAYMREMAMVLRVFPVDPVLTGLGPATDESRVLSALAAHLPECRDGGWRPRELRFDVVRYKPGRVCTLRYDVRLEQPARRAERWQAVYGKVFADERWQRIYALLDASWNAACASGGVWRAARPILTVPEWRLILQEGISGSQFRTVLGELSHDEATDAQLARLDVHLAAVARAVRTMQRAPVQLGPPCDFETLLARQARNLDHLRQVHPALAEEVARLREELLRLARVIPAQPLGLTHGDFAHGNVLLGDDGVGIIDFERAVQAEPAYDVAYFLTHLTSFGLRHPRRLAHIERLCEAFRRAYLNLAPEVPPERLALYEALDLAAYVLRNFRKQSHRASWLQWTHGQIRAAWERLGQVAGDARAVQ